MPDAEMSHVSEQLVEPGFGDGEFISPHSTIFGSADGSTRSMIDGFQGQETSLPEDERIPDGAADEHFGTRTSTISKSDLDDLLTVLIASIDLMRTTLVTEMLVIGTLAFSITTYYTLLAMISN